jgi:hypothetical protein
MKIKLKVKPVVRTAKEASEDLFWAAACTERNPVKNLEITKQIDRAITKHEGNVRRNPKS